MLRKSYLALLLLLFAFALAPGLVTTPIQAQNLGTNWTGQFYNSTTLSGAPVATISYPNGLCFNWGQGAPRTDGGQCVAGTVIPGVNADGFSARFTSTQTFQPGTYTFIIRVNDGVRLLINGFSVLEQLNTQVASNFAEYTVTQVLNGPVNLEVQYVDFTGDAILQVQWSLTGTAGPTSTPAPIATVSVVRVRGLAVRTGPYLGASLITVARPNIAYPVLARSNSEGLFVWYRIQVGDNTGWASGRYLQPAGNMDAIPFTDSIFDRIDNPELPSALNVVGVPRAIMNFRIRPSDRTQIIDKIPWGAEVQVIGRTIQGGKNFWLQVRYNGRVGWIFAPYVGLRGVIDAVPTY